MRGILRFITLAGLVLFLFGLIPYALSGVFDLWTAVHIVGGGILIAAGVVLDFAGVRRTVTARRTRERARAALGAVLFAGILVALYVLAVRHPFQWDVTENRLHTLSDKTRAVLAELEHPVELLAFWPGSDGGRAAVQELLERYALQSGKIEWRFVDAVVEPELAHRHGVDSEHVLVAVGGEQSPRAQGDPDFGLTEGTVTNLLLKLEHTGARTIYALSGHGEPAPDDLQTPGGIGALARVLADEGFRLQPLRLATAERVPDDAALLLVVATDKPLIEHEHEQLAAYLEGGGRVLLLLDPRTDAGLAEFAARYGVVAGDDILVDREERPFLGPRLGLAPIVEDFPPHAMTRNFDGEIVLFEARSVRPAPQSPQLADVAVLGRTRPESWAESDYRAMFEQGAGARDADDLPGPVPVAVAASWQGDSGVETRLIVIGDADLARNGALNRFFNLEFLLAGVQWLVGNEQLIAEGPRGWRPSRLDMTDADYRNIFRLSVLLLPETVVLLGLALWWRRRSL